MSALESKAVAPPPPRGKVYLKTHSTTAARYKIDPDWKGEFVTVVSQTSDLSIRFGKGGVSVSVTKQATTGATDSEVLAAHQGAGFVVPAGSYQSFYVDKDDTHFAVDSSDTSGDWCIYRSSGRTYAEGEPLPLPPVLPEPVCHVDFSAYEKLTLSSSDITGVLAAAGKNVKFSEATNPPARVEAASATGIRDNADFATGSSEKLVSTTEDLIDAVDDTDAFTVFVAAERASATAAHCLFSFSTDGTANGRFALTCDASDDVVATRVDSAGSSTSLTYTATIAAGEIHGYTYTFDGSAGDLYVDSVNVSTSGSNSGDLGGDISHVAIGARAENTATYDSFWDGEVYDVIVWDVALSAAELTALHEWAQRRYGV